jgi:hypothetical protein
MHANEFKKHTFELLIRHAFMLIMKAGIKI